MKTNHRLNILTSLALLSASALVAGCTILPETANVSKSPWAGYTDAKAAFEKVQIGKTTKSDLQGLGLSPDLVPNTRTLNYVDVVNLFGSTFRLEDLPQGIRQCVEAREGCQAFIIRAQNVRNKREGNVPADLFGFKKRVRTTGWEFSATLVLVHNTVTYKLWNGTPAIESTTNENNPLGPMQSLSGVIPKPF
jgi:hypothetical protein